MTIAAIFWWIAETLAAAAAMTVAFALWAFAIWGGIAWLKNFRQYSTRPLAKWLRRRAFLARERARAAA
jgi:hypothetical protein